MVKMSDERLISELTEYRFLELELRDWHVPYDRSEWAGEDRWSAGVRVAARVEALMEEVKQRKLDLTAALDAAERQFIARWGDSH